MRREADGTRRRRLVCLCMIEHTMPAVPTPFLLRLLPMTEQMSPAIPKMRAGTPAKLTERADDAWSAYEQKGQYSGYQDNGQQASGGTGQALIAHDGTDEPRYSENESRNAITAAGAYGQDAAHQPGNLEAIERRGDGRHGVFYHRPDSGGDCNRLLRHGHQPALWRPLAVLSEPKSFALC